MASFRKYKGGAEKERERKEKACRQQEIISKSTKLSTNFGSTNNTLTSISETEAMQSEDAAHAHHEETDPTVPLLADSFSITSLSPVSEDNSDIGTWGNLPRRNSNCGFKGVMRSANIGRMTCLHQFENSQPIHSDIVQSHSSLE